MLIVSLWECVCHYLGHIVGKFNQSKKMEIEFYRLEFCLEISEKKK